MFLFTCETCPECLRKQNTLAIKTKVILLQNSFWLLPGYFREPVATGHLEASLSAGRSELLPRESSAGSCRNGAVPAVGCSMGIAPAQMGELSFSEHRI